MHIAFISVLVLLQILVLITPHIGIEPSEAEVLPINIEVENIPVTRQLRRSPPPPKPTVPVPSDDESIPEDETIEETNLRLSTFFDDANGMTAPSVTLVPAKPIAWVFPEYPEEEKKKGVQGVIRLSIHINSLGKVVEVLVIENTTNSERCAQAAVAAAYGSRFFPARERGQAVGSWITQPYRFNIEE